MKNEIKKFGYALRGLRILFAGERHAQIHLIAAVLVIAAGLFFNISHQEWTIVAIAIAAVIAAEAFNTAIEKLCDIVQPERLPA